MDETTKQHAERHIEQLSKLIHQYPERAYYVDYKRKYELILNSYNKGWNDALSQIAALRQYLEERITFREEDLEYQRIHFDYIDQAGYDELTDLKMKLDELFPQDDKT